MKISYAASSEFSMAKLKQVKELFIAAPDVCSSLEPL